MLIKVPRLFESHTHFTATGEFAAGLNLHNLEQPDHLLEVDVTNSSYYRGEWLVGFGWNEKKWQKAPSKQLLDRIFPDRPVFLSREDGHQSWVNSIALKTLGLESETGVLVENEHLWVWDNLPDYTKSQIRAQILTASRLYNNAGFTHVRDLSCSESLWNILVEMSDANELTVAIEENITLHKLDEFDNVLQFCLAAKKSETPLVRFKGLKVYFDGTLGSETAFISQPYYGKLDNSCGKALWQISDLQEAMKKTWGAGLEFSVHTIGDEAAHQVVKAARAISAQGAVGRLNLEHVQVLRPETIQMMKPLHIRCHMQPCHWLSDRAWLKEKLADLYKFAFPWEALRAAKIPLSFGCDSPIEPPSFLRNIEALSDSPKEKIKKFTGDISHYHSHPDRQFAPSETVIESNEIKSVIFCGKQLLG